MWLFIFFFFFGFGGTGFNLLGAIYMNVRSSWLINAWLVDFIGLLSFYCRLIEFMRVLHKYIRNLLINGLVVLVECYSAH